MGPIWCPFYLGLIWGPFYLGPWVLFGVPCELAKIKFAMLGLTPLSHFEPNSWPKSERDSWVIRGGDLLRS